MIHTIISAGEYWAIGSVCVGVLWVAIGRGLKR